MRESIEMLGAGTELWQAAVPAAHRFDEFPAGYPLAGCSPAEPASVSPAMSSMPQIRSVGDDSPANGNLSLSRLSQRWGSVHQAVPLSPLSHGQEAYGTSDCDDLLYAVSAFKHEENGPQISYKVLSWRAVQQGRPGRARRRRPGDIRVADTDFF